MDAGLHDGATWRIAPAPFALSPEDHAAIESLGPRLLSFTQALNRLYYDSVEGAAPRWVADYLDQGKPAGLIEFARSERFRKALPGVIRPDLILTEDGFMISELDSVPGGIGLTGCMAEAYADLGWSVIGGRNGMVDGFASMIRHCSREGAPKTPLPNPPSPSLAIVVSEEAKDYRPEMRWLAERLSESGMAAHAITPEEVAVLPEGLAFHGAPITTLYRFFELFDLKNIPQADALLAAPSLTPPPKPWLEEKLAFALLHHPDLEGFWSGALDGETFALLRRMMPPSWIVDPRADIRNLNVKGQAVTDWRSVGQLGQKGRRFVLKPSGFSPLAWGSRGVSVDHDLPQQEWAGAIDAALAGFAGTPYILQEFRKGRRVASSWHDPVRDEIIPMEGRVRLSPYYFVANDSVNLGGVLATVVSLDKKLIHGMTDAVMSPCMLGANP